jgi:hypothetical protein
MEPCKVVTLPLTPALSTRCSGLLLYVHACAWFVVRTFIELDDVRMIHLKNGRREREGKRHTAKNAGGTEADTTSAPV